MAKINLLTEDEARELTREARRKSRNRLVEDQVKGQAPRGGFHGKTGSYTRKSRGGKSWGWDD